MSEDFFRKEAIKGRRADWLGELRLQAPHYGWAFLALGAATTLLIFAALFLAQYTRRERVPGVLRANRGILEVRAAKEGAITRVLVHDGEKVSAGQPLIYISNDLASVTLGETRESIRAELLKKSTGLQREIQQKDAILAASRLDFSNRIAAIDSQIASVSRQIKIQKERVANLSALYEKWVAFKDTEVISKAQLLERRDELLQQTAQVDELERSRLGYVQQRSELKQQMLNIPIDISQQKGELSRTLADVSQALAENEVDRGLVMKAQTDGVVTNLSVHPGDQVAALQRILTIVPSDTRLLAELWVPSRAIGFIEVGGPVVLRYRAFPYQKFGSYGGEVSMISRSGLRASEVDSKPSNQDDDTYYRVLVNLDNQSVATYGRPEPLLPGMELDADIAVERRRLVEWIFEPVFGLARAQSKDQRPVRQKHGG